MAELADVSHMNKLIEQLDKCGSDKEKSCIISIEIFSYLIKFPELIQKENYLSNIAQEKSDELIKHISDGMKTKEVTTENGTNLINKINELKIIAAKLFNIENITY